MAERGLVDQGGQPRGRPRCLRRDHTRGPEAIEEAAPAHVELVQRLLFDGLSAAQVRTLATIALSVVRRLEGD